MDSLSADNSLVELTGLSFSIGYRVINKRATVRPQFGPASLEGEHVSMQPTYTNTLPGTTSIITPLAKSTPITLSS